jgi:tRNA G10  N-methylase Trm11
MASEPIRKYNDSMKSLIIHGRQPAMGHAELESLYGAEKIRPVGSEGSLVDIDPADINFARLGGMVKFCKVLTTLDTVNWADIDSFLIETSPHHFKHLSEGKLKIGISVYGLSLSPSQIQKTALRLKKAGKESGQSIRIIPNKEKVLNSATVLYNGLTKKMGWELVFLRDGQKTIVAQSIAVQDIDAYRRRDHERPFRDPKVGMLPPKLAQIIINLAIGNTDPEKEQVDVFDPFCGTGVLLQEALLMNCRVLGADIDERMVKYSQSNIEWLQGHISNKGRLLKVFLGDATKGSDWSGEANYIATETYLGRPFSSVPDRQILNNVVQDVNMIHKKFLQNVARQTHPGFRMCIAVPAWKTKNGFLHLPVLDSLEKLGYNRVSFVHANNNDLIYHRPNQIVARELIVLQRI